MRKFICVFTLAAVMLIASASDLLAQRGRGGSRRGAGSVTVGSGYRGGTYYGGRYYGGRGYYYYGAPYFYGGRYYYDPYYYTAPDYYSDPAVQVPATDVRQSYYSDPNSASIAVFLPNPDAQVWFDEAATSQRGMERMFYTPALQQSGTYVIKARWVENGRTVDQQRQVQVQPGQSATVSFRANPTEKLPSPLPKK